MDAAFETRKQELLDECSLDPQVFDRVMPRLERFMSPFVVRLVRKQETDLKQSKQEEDREKDFIHSDLLVVAGATRRTARRFGGARQDAPAERSDHPRR